MNNRNIATTMLFSAVLSTVSGCAFTRLKTESEGLERKVVVIGQVSYSGEPRGDLVAVVYKVGRITDRTHSFRVVDWRLKKFVFLLDPGQYRIAVLHDRDGDLRADEGEPFKAANRGEVLDFYPSQKRQELRLDLDSEDPDSSKAIRKWIPGRKEQKRQDYYVAMGDRASFQEEKFGREAGEMGMWEPKRFLEEHGIGVYSRGPYDPEKIPVLFVSGVKGNAEHWSRFLESLDEDDYQAWYYLYPSGARISRLGYALSAITGAMKEMYGFEELHVVSHSMGGLVAGDFIRRQKSTEGGGYVSKWITIATPFGGHEAASSVDFLSTSLTEPVPAWKDMVPGCDFLKALMREDISQKTRFYLVSAKLPGEPGDGTISSKSQKDPSALKRAYETKEFQAGHVSVLQNADVISYVLSSLDG